MVGRAVAHPAATPEPDVVRPIAGAIGWCRRVGLEPLPKKLVGFVARRMTWMCLAKPRQDKVRV